MCSAFQLKKEIFIPGRKIVARAESGVVRHVWAGFARNEIIGWWQRKGGVFLDIPLTRFAERSDITRNLVWDDAPEGLVLRGVLDLDSPNPLIKIVTRASTEKESACFQHHRMPLLTRPLFEQIPSGVFDDINAAPASGDAQSELF